MTIFQCVIVAGIMTGIFWLVRFVRAYMDWMILNENLTVTYYLMNVKRCHVKEDEDYFLEIEKRMIPKDAEDETFAESMQNLLVPTFLAYQKLKIIFTSNVTSFVPCFHKENLLRQLTFLLDRCSDALERYKKLDLLAAWLLYKKYESLVKLGEVMDNKWVEIDRMKEETICFFEKDR